MVQLNIPLGYTIVEEKTNVSVEQARELLIAKKYTCAERDDYMVELKKHYIQCPFCNHRVYAYVRDFNKVFGYKFIPNKRVSKDEIIDWTSQQLNLLEREYKPLFLNEVVNITSNLTCPECKNTMQHFDKKRAIQFERREHKIYVRAEIFDVVELFSTPCLYEGEVSIEFPLFEVVCFNLKRGHTYVCLEAANGQRLAVRDVTYDKCAWSAGVLYDTITKYKYIRRVIKRLFEEEWKSNIPFYPSEIGVDEMRLLTSFVGYDRNFYCSIPFEKGSFNVEKSFGFLSQKMHCASETVLLYKNSALPNMKSIKRLFFSNKGLFFYIEECERMWKIIKDPNYFLTFLKNKEIYEILSCLHIRPKIIEFLGDYTEIGGTKPLLKLINKHWGSVCRYAVDYSNMSDYMQKLEQKKWKCLKKDVIVERRSSFSIPMCHPDEKIRNCRIDDFVFFWLKTSMDYREAGEQLNNCLKEWSNFNRAVVCVKKHGRIIAALEIRNGFVLQALSINNESLKSRKIPGLYEAYIKWLEKNNVSESPLFVNAEDEQEDEFAG